MGTSAYGENYLSFVNGQYTNDGGTHQSAFREGILKGVNDEAINSPNKALELFEKLKNSDAVNLDLERRGREVKMDYTIK